MQLCRFSSRLAALASLALLIGLTPSAKADAQLAGHWPFNKKKESCEPSCPAAQPAPAPELIPPPAQKEPEKKEPEKKEPEKKELPPVVQPPIIAPPVVDIPEA